MRMLLDPMIAGLNMASADSNFTINRHNVRLEIAKRAEMMREKIRLEVKKKMLCLKIDCATRLDRKVIGINTQFTHDGVRKLRCLCMKEVFESQTGEFLKGVLDSTLRKFNISKSQVLRINFLVFFFQYFLL